MENADSFQIQAREQADARAASANLAAAARPELEAMPELRERMRAALDELARMRQAIRPHAQPTQRRRFGRRLIRQRWRTWGTLLFHPALVRLRLGIAWTAFLLIWPYLWRALLVIAAIVAALAGLRWLIENYQQILRFLQG